MRVGILGGSFDPVHYGHLLLAEQCREQCRLDRVWFLPAAVPPHKIGCARTPGPQRVAMLELAIGGHEAFSICTWELDRGGVNYTWETLAALAAQHPAAELFFLMGADSLRDLPSWREPARICQLATPVVVRRQGAPEPDLAVLAPLVSAPRFAAIRACQVQMPVVEFSSTAIRQAVATGRSIRYQTPRAVEKYLETHGLYQAARADDTAGADRPPGGHEPGGGSPEP